MESIKFLAIILVLSFVPGVCTGQHSVVPKEGFVPDERTAVRIAEAIFVPVFGQRQVEAEKPFRARLASDHWIVSGTLRKPRNHDLIVMGGSMTVEIDKATGRIIDVYHGK